MKNQITEHSSREEVLAAVAQKGWVLRDASKDLKKDKEVVLKAVSQDGLALRYASEDLQEDKEVVLKAVSQNGLALEYAHEDFQDQTEVVLKAVSQNGLALKYASEDLQEDEEVVLAAIANDRWALQFAHEDFKKDKEVVLKAVANNGRALQFAHEDLKKDKEVVLKAVANNGLALQFAHEDLKKDNEVVLKAVSQNVNAQQYVHPDLKKNTTVTKAAAEPKTIEVKKEVKIEKTVEEKKKAPQPTIIDTPPKDPLTQSAQGKKPQPPKEKIGQNQNTLQHEYNRLSKKLLKLDELREFAKKIGGKLDKQWAQKTPALSDIKTLLKGSELSPERAQFVQMTQQAQVELMQKMEKDATDLLKPLRKSIDQELPHCIAMAQNNTQNNTQNLTLGYRSDYPKDYYDAQRCLRELDELEKREKTTSPNPREEQLLNTAALNNLPLAQMILRGVTQEAIGETLRNHGFAAQLNNDQSQTYTKDGARITVYPTESKNGISETKIAWNSTHVETNETIGALAKNALEDPKVNITISAASADKVAAMIQKAGGTDEHLAKLLVGEDRIPYTQWRQSQDKKTEHTQIELEVDHRTEPPHPK